VPAPNSDTNDGDAIMRKLPEAFDQHPGQPVGLEPKHNAHHDSAWKHVRGSALYR